MCQFGESMLSNATRGLRLLRSPECSKQALGDCQVVAVKASGRASWDGGGCGGATAAIADGLGRRREKPTASPVRSSRRHPARDDCLNPAAVHLTCQRVLEVDSGAGSHGRCSGPACPAAAARSRWASRRGRGRRGTPRLQLTWSPRRPPAGRAPPQPRSGCSCRPHRRASSGVPTAGRPHERSGALDLKRY